jgi:hypothetical protein
MFIGSILGEGVIPQKILGVGGKNPKMGCPALVVCLDPGKAPQKNSKKKKNH